MATETLEGRSGKRLLDLNSLRERGRNGLSKLQRGNTNVGNVERVASVLGAAALAAWALKSRRKGAMGLALAGLPLAWRGATGHCAVYQKLGIDRLHGHSGRHELTGQGRHDESTGAAVGLESTGGETRASAPGGQLGQEQSF